MQEEIGLGVYVGKAWSKLQKNFWSLCVRRGDGVLCSRAFGGISSTTTLLACFDGASLPAADVEHAYSVRAGSHREVRAFRAPGNLICLVRERVSVVPPP